jgi:ABC-type phosphate transport system substrate-binding protein
MKRLARTITLLLGLLVAFVARAEIVVVVNTNHPVTGFNQQELADLYMGRNLYFPDGSLALRLDQTPKSQIRNGFYRKLVNKSVAEVNAYWAKLLFSGRATPPQTAEDSLAILNAVQNNLYAIGYIDSEDLTDQVKVVARVD